MKKKIRPGAYCWVCGNLMPSTEPVDTCVDCVDWRYFQHADSDCVFKTCDPTEAFSILSDPSVDEIDEDLYHRRIADGWSGG